MSAKEWRAQERQRKFVKACKENSPETFAFHVGVDLGKQRDNTVISCIETITPKGGEPKHIVKAIDIFPLKMDFNLQAEKIHDWHQRDCLKLWPTKSATDGTGLGSPVIDQLRKLGHRCTKIVITSGDTSSFHDGA